MYTFIISLFLPFHFFLQPTPTQSFFHHFTDLIVVTKDLYWHHAEITHEILLLLLLCVFFLILKIPELPLFPNFLFKTLSIPWATQKISELITSHGCCLQPMNLNVHNHMLISTHVGHIWYSPVYYLDPFIYSKTSCI